MNTWNEMIEMRRAKEERFENPLELKIAIEDYDRAIGYGIAGLSELERRAINYRFVCGLQIARVADRLGMSWEGADAFIDDVRLRVLKRLKGSRFEFKPTEKGSAP